MIRRNEIPILEYDDSSNEIIPPDHDWTADRLPEKCLFAFLGDVVHEYSAKHNARVVETLITVSHDIKIYALHEKDEDICLVQSPIGAAASAQVLDTLVSCGCKKIIAVGSCGVLADIEENAFIVPCKALRAEGASYHYLPASRYIELDEEPISIMRETFRETEDMVKYRREEGCSVVEMECAALAACCRLRGAKFGQFLFTADSLANLREYDAREFGMRSHEKALLLGLDILRNYN